MGFQPPQFQRFASVATVILSPDPFERPPNFEFQGSQNTEGNPALVPTQSAELERSFVQGLLSNNDRVVPECLIVPRRHRDWMLYAGPPGTVPNVRKPETVCHALLEKGSGKADTEDQRVPSMMG